MGKGQLSIGEWLDNGGGKDIGPMAHTDGVEVLRTMQLLTSGDKALPEGDKALRDEPECTIYFKCSAFLLGRVIRTLEKQRDEAGR